MPNLQACVLAAGKGTRMGGDRPKVLFEAEGKPLLEWVLGALSDAGVDDLVVVVGYRKDDIVAMLPTGVRWAEQSPQLGTGHAVRCARAAFPDTASDIIVTYGDMPLVTPETYRRLVDIRIESGAAATILSVPVPPDSRFGRIIRNELDEVVKIVEYKDATPEERARPEGNAGVYCFDAAALWPALEQITNANAQGEYYLTDVIEILRRQGRGVTALFSEVAGEELGVNTPEDLAAAQMALRERGRIKETND
ncbi:MAG: NTP transferase domain-containing protein [Planctomycetes bacterium]|nr:NTP transferase domain-containing protein [Planctomycetota bacterium]